MKITLQNQYKSLRPFESDDLENFTIITGKNGSGKSQLLSRFAFSASGQNRYNGNDQQKVVLSVPLDRIQVEGIVKQESVQIGHDQWKQIIEGLISRFGQITPARRRLLELTSTFAIDFKDIQTPVVGLRFEDENIKAAITEVLKQSNLAGQFRQYSEEGERVALHIVYQPDVFKAYKIGQEVSEFTGKPANKLSSIDFYNSPIKEQFVDADDLFASQVEYVFYNYAKRRDLNRKDFFYKKEDGVENGSMSNDDFERLFIPPWITINSLLVDNNLDFYFKGIDKREFSADVPVDFLLTKRSTDEIIPFADLSSGEKVIIGLVIKLFTSKYYGETLTFPQLLILDEPDAHLHPEMSKLMLDVLGETFVKKYGIKVIMSTHSPSTIALADENCIYQLTNGANTSLKKIPKDVALKILTGFIPTLSIDYNNHRQVFVESPTDVLYYQSLYAKHGQVNALTHKLYFISNAPGKSNCDQVYKIVEQIRESGSTTAFGMVDWDTKNQPTPFIQVHGFEERYSVENFILDPVYVVCLLIDTNNAHGVMGSIGIDSSYNQYLLGTESPKRIQSIVDYYFSEFERKYPMFKSDSERVTVEYLNGKTAKIPKWYLLMQGHEIVTKIKGIFPALDQTKYQAEGAMQKALTVIMSKSYPFVPLTSIKVIEAIAGKASS